MQRAEKLVDKGSLSHEGETCTIKSPLSSSHPQTELGKPQN